MKRTVKMNVTSIVSVALMTALISVCSLVAIPAPLPITLQTFAIYFSLFVLGGYRGTISVILYVLIGAVGLPVFAGATAGVFRLFDATGGFIFGFVVAAILFWLFSMLLPSNGKSALLCAFLSLCFLYAIGALWFAFVYLNGKESIMYVLYVCVFPFILPDAVKIFLAYFLAKKVKRIINI